MNGKGVGGKLEVDTVFAAPRKILQLPNPALRGLADYSIMEPFSAGQIGVPRGAKHVIGIGTAPCFAVK
jgi:hypothetical protein